MTKSLSYCGSFKDKYNRRYGLVYMVGYGVPVQGCAVHCMGRLLKKKVLAFKTPGFPTVLRPRTYTNIIGFQLLSAISSSYRSYHSYQERPRTKGHEPKATNHKATNQINYTRTR